MTGRRGFTLVEMIVALAVTSVLTVMMLRMFTDSSTIWKREDDRLDTFREARAALHLMASELSTVNPVPDVNPNTAPGAPEQFPALALRYHSDTAEEDKGGNQEIYALASLPNPGKSDLCAIGFFCQWNAVKKCFVLKRQFADSDLTFTRLQQVLKATAPMHYPGSFDVLYSRAAAPATGGTSVAVEPVQDVASYVWDLQFTLLPPAPANSKVVPTPAPWPQGIYARELPQWIEIRFKALGAAGARKLEGTSLNRADWFEPKKDTYQRLILPGEQQFVTRVKLSR
jgi:prepilin-type N-terminal cleavage/methylation domain-containing protein